MEAAMIEEAIEIRTSDGIADGFLYRADGAGKLPGAIHLTDIGGIRPSHREMAKRLARKSYTGAMPTAAAMPGKVAAVASFHGGGLYSDEPTSPHLLLPRIKARLYFGHATNDRSMSTEAIAKFDSALAAWGGKYESEVYEGAFHGWTVPDAPVYNPPQADRAFDKLTGLFASTLK